jgi:hypothetical protein
MIRIFIIVLSLMVVGCTTTQQEQPAGMIFGAAIPPPGAPDKPTHLRLGVMVTPAGIVYLTWDLPTTYLNGDPLPPTNIDYTCVYLDADPCVKIYAPGNTFASSYEISVGTHSAQVEVWGTDGDHSAKTPPFVFVF